MRFDLVEFVKSSGGRMRSCVYILIYKGLFNVHNNGGQLYLKLEENWVKFLQFKRPIEEESILLSLLRVTAYYFIHSVEEIRFSFRQTIHTQRYIYIYIHMCVSVYLLSKHSLHDFLFAFLLASKLTRSVSIYSPDEMRKGKEIPAEEVFTGES